MSWIRKIPYDEAEGELREIYDRIAGEDGYLDNILTIHGQRPNTLEGHMALYKHVLHSRHNRLPKWRLEMLGVFTSILNGCDYCVAHHFEGLRGLLNDDARAQALRYGMEETREAGRGGDAHLRAFDRLVQGGVLEAVDRAMLAYAHKLTLSPGAMEAADVEVLRAVGCDEGEILEINQVVSYFAYVNRTATGLGVDLDGDTLGLSPGEGDDPDNWRHDAPRE